MRNKNYFLPVVVIILFFSCKNGNINFTDKDFTENGIRVKGRFLNDTIRDGVFTYFYSSGEKSRIEFYENDSIKGLVGQFDKNKKILSYALLDEDSGSYQISWYPNGDTLCVIEKHIVKKYFENKNIESLTNYSDSIYEKISFSEDGRIAKYKGPLNFLTKKDSFDLDKSYPDWKDQVKKWENK